MAAQLNKEVKKSRNEGHWVGDPEVMNRRVKEVHSIKVVPRLVSLTGWSPKSWVDEGLNDGVDEEKSERVTETLGEQQGNGQVAESKPKETHH